VADLRTGLEAARSLLTLTARSLSRELAGTATTVAAAS
jgi:hypothetical protein